MKAPAAFVPPARGFVDKLRLAAHAERALL
jgi:hypothetical protein